MINKELIDYLSSNSGKLKGGESWYDIGKRFGLLPKDKKRAKKDKAYEKEAIGKKANDIWRNYLKSKNKLQLVKETYKDGQLQFEMFRRVPEEQDFSLENMELEGLTTNPNGGQWLKYKRKERLYDESHIEHLREILIKEIEPLSEVVVNHNNDKGLFIHGSDKHIGALTKLNSVYNNKYDKQEMIKRLVEATIMVIEENVSIFGVFDSLFIMEYGDALDGFNQKTTGGLRGTSSHTLPQQYNNREQHDLYVELHKQLFDIICQKGYAKQIYFIATCNSNHGGDFEYGAMRHLEGYINIRYPFVKTVVSYTPLNHFTYGKHCIIFGHGKDDEDMKNGFPLTLNEKIENYISDYIRVNKLEEYHVSFISGDLHQSAETYGKNFRYKKVLSQYGSSKWMHTNFGSGTPGLCSEVFWKDNHKIMKSDEFFNIGNQSNTGVNFK